MIKLLEKINPKIRFCLFSAQGATPDESSFFLFGRAKGRAEKLLLDSNLKNQYIFKPGYIRPGKNTKKYSFFDSLLFPIYKLFPAIGIA